MPREIFGEVANPAPRLGSQSRYTLPVSIAVHVSIAAAVVIVPLMATDMLPEPRTVIGVFTAQSSPPPPPPPAAASAASAKASQPAAEPAAPMSAPDTIAPEPATTTATLPDEGVPGGVPGGLPGGLVGSVGAVPDAPPIPEPPAPPRPVPVGGRIKEPTKIRHVPPVYPVIAQQARVDGVVIIEAVIGTDGRVREARVLQSKALLDEAALAAVRQWVFTPTTLNGSPIPVIMTVRVNFRLN